MSIKTISLIGAGAIGASFASKFYDMDPNCISLVAKGERYDRLKKRGLIVNDKHYSLNLIRPEEKAPPSDLVFVAVKYHHLEEAIRDIANRVGKDTLIISALNGIDSEERICAAYGIKDVLYSIVFNTGAQRQTNRITFSPKGKIIFGEAKNLHPSERVKKVQSLFDQAGINYETPEDMIRMLWWKFMCNVGINQVSTIFGANHGFIQQSTEAKEIMLSAMQEVLAIAKTACVQLYEEDIKNWNSTFSRMPPNWKTSMLQDFEAKRKTEIEMFAGKVIELGTQYGIPTPVNQTLYRIIKVMELHQYTKTISTRL